jgi:tRNA threonylcarbamoyl adenosine modification protein YeaZ
MLIAFEAVERAGSVCAWDGDELAFERCPGHAEAHLVPLIDRLMRQHAPVSALAVAVGPGSFAGLRVAALAARTIAWHDQLPVHAVDSLAAGAVQQGDGLWLVLLPLKRDTTFHGLFRVAGGIVTTLSGTTACRDDLRPSLLPEAAAAVAIGPALTAKPGLAERWQPGIALGDPAGPDARGVARLAGQVPPLSWDRVLPLYHQEPAPVLQRAAALEALRV